MLLKKINQYAKLAMPPWYLLIIHPTGDGSSYVSHYMLGHLNGLCMHKVMISNCNLHGTIVLPKQIICINWTWLRFVTFGTILCKVPLVMALIVLIGEIFVQFLLLPPLLVFFLPNLSPTSRLTFTCTWEIFESSSLESCCFFSFLLGQLIANWPILWHLEHL